MAPARVRPKPFIDAAFLRSSMLGDVTATQPGISEICPCRQRAGFHAGSTSPRRPARLTGPARVRLRHFLHAAFLSSSMSGDVTATQPGISEICPCHQRAGFHAGSSSPRRGGVASPRRPARLTGPARMGLRHFFHAAFLRSSMLGDVTATQSGISEICPCHQRAGFHAGGTSPRRGRVASPRRPARLMAPARMGLRHFFHAAFLRSSVLGDVTATQPGISEICPCLH